MPGIQEFEGLNGACADRGSRARQLVAARSEVALTLGNLTGDFGIFSAIPEQMLAPLHFAATTVLGPHTGGRPQHRKIV